MIYNQKVEIKNTNYSEVKSAFHDFKFLKYLTKFQPVKIISWNGIKNGETAHFRFWMLGWRNLTVYHKNYKEAERELSFTDYAKSPIPFGISTWVHHHSAVKNSKGVYIEDTFEFNHRSTIAKYLLYPILITPIASRKIFYKLYFKNK